MRRLSVSGLIAREPQRLRPSFAAANTDFAQKSEDASNLWHKVGERRGKQICAAISQGRACSVVISHK
jgi:hypothetical protein